MPVRFAERLAASPGQKDPNFTYKDAIILLTDGYNTQNRWYSSSSMIDARQKILCDNAKAANITIYTVQVNTGGDPIQSRCSNIAPAERTSSST